MCAYIFYNDFNRLTKLNSSCFSENGPDNLVVFDSKSLHIFLHCKVSFSVFYLLFNFFGTCGRLKYRFMSKA